MTTLGTMLASGRPPAALADTLRSRTVGIDRFARLMGTVTATDLMAALADVLETPLGAVAVQSWNDHLSVRKARKETLEDELAYRLVALQEHTLSSEHKPVIEVEVNGVPQPELRLELSLKVTITVSAARLRIVGGEITAVHHGEAEASGELSAYGLTLAEGKVTLTDDLAEGTELRRLPGPART